MNKNFPSVVTDVPEKVQAYAFRNIYSPNLVNVPSNPDEPVTFNEKVKVLDSDEGSATVYTDGALYRDDIIYFTCDSKKYAICFDGKGNFEVRN